MKHIKFKSAVLLIALFAFSKLSGQNVIFDKAVRAGDLTLFPEVGNENVFYYLPDKVNLAKHPDGSPQFSMIRYVKNEKTAGNRDDGISESAEGGGLLHVVVEMKVPDDMLERARQELRRIKGNGIISGPVLYKGGTVALISSVASTEGGMAKKVVGLGPAPVLDGGKAAVSVLLNKLGAKLLWESFKTPTPDVSFSFQMTADGYHSPISATVEADWSSIYSHRAFDAGVRGNMGPIVLGAEISAAFEDLRKSNAIKITQVGDDAQMNSIVNAVQSKLIEMMFDRSAGNGVPDFASQFGNNSSMLDRASTMLTQARDETRRDNAELQNRRRQQAQQEIQARQRAESAYAERVRAAGGTLAEPTESQRLPTDPAQAVAAAGEAIPADAPMPQIAAVMSFRMRETRQSGKFYMNMNKYTSYSQSFPIVHNIGPINCEKCFLEVNLDDPLMKQREINAALNLNSIEDFKYINFVSVLMRKKHENGETTPDEVKIDKMKFGQEGNYFKMMYGYKGDVDRNKWLKYEYKTMWSFLGGTTMETDWKPGEFGSITLDPPLVKKPVFVEIDREFVLNEDIRGIELTVRNKIGTQVKTQTFVFKTSKEELSATFDLLQPANADKYEYEYQITYLPRGKEPITSPNKTTQRRSLMIDMYEK
jgi:hypothetical protein